MNTSRPSRIASKRKSHVLDDEDGDELDSLPQLTDEDECDDVEASNEADDDNDDAADDEEENTSGKDQHEAGQILRIYLEDFMCHRKFDISFGRHLNFVTGLNGSGKSAIANAITLGLGSSAKTTGRGSSAHLFIREGSRGPAIIKITLLNTGSDAYKPNEYGRKIVVVRKITKTGGSTYELRSDQDKLISNNKSELRSMLDSFHIFVDTPCCMLTQEDSKKLLHGNNKDKFQFFLRATGLKMLFDTLHNTVMNLKDCKEQTEAHSHDVKEKNKILLDWDMKLKKYQQFGNLENQIKVFEAKTFWCDYNAYMENEVEEAENNLQQKMEVLARLTEELAVEELDVDDVHIQQKLDEANEELERIQREENELSGKLADVKGEAQQAHREVNEINNEIKKYSDKQKEFVDRLKSVNHELSESKQKALKAAKQDERQLLDEIERLEKEIDHLRDTEQELEKQKQDQNRSFVHIKQQADNINRSISVDRAQVDKLRQDINNLSSTNNDKSSMYGRSIPQLLDRIKKTHFNRPVYGPIGMHISINEGFDQWDKALEKGVGSVLNSFIVVDKEDRFTLQNLMKSIDQDLPRRHTIITQPPCARYSIGRLPMNDGITIADALLIPDDDVFNAFIDQTGMDRIALVANEGILDRDYKEVQRNGNDRLKYDLSAVITIDGTNITFREGNRAADLLKHYQYKGILRRDMGSLIDEKQRSLREYENRIADSQREHSDLSQQLRQISINVQDFERSMKRNTDDIFKVQREKKRLQQKLGELEESSKIDYSDLESEKEDLDREIINLKDEINKRSFSLNDAKDNYKRKTSEKQEIEMLIRDQANRLDEQMRSIESICKKREDGKKQKDRKKKRFDHAQREHDEYVKEFDRIAKMKDQLLTKAHDKTRELITDWDGSPLHLTRKDTRQLMERKARDTKTELEASKKELNMQGYDLTYLTNQVQVSKADYDSLKEKYDLLVTRTKALRIKYKYSKEKISDDMKYLIDQIKNRFDEYCNKQGSAGTIVFNTEEEELELKVQMDNNDTNTKAGDVRNLSGGERSYVSFCFLLALGFVVESPFRLMDEYDVFMDEARRNKTLETLQQYSMRATLRSKQFIIITPNNINSVKTNKNGNTNLVKIHKMPNPKRANLSAHGLQQQTIATI